MVTGTRKPVWVNETDDTLGPARSSTTLTSDGMTTRRIHERSQASVGSCRASVSPKNTSSSSPLGNQPRNNAVNELESDSRNRLTSMYAGEISPSNGLFPGGVAAAVDEDVNGP